MIQSINFDMYTNFPNLKTSIIFESISINNVSVNHSPLIKTGLGAVVDINIGTFTYIESTYLDSGIFSTESDSIININRSVFQYNSAISSSIFRIKDDSEIQCVNCTISNNFAISSGVLSTERNGMVGLYSTTINNNYAVQHPIGLLFGFNKVSIISNCEIFQNEAISMDQVIQEISSCTNLCFLKTNLQHYLSNVGGEDISTQFSSIQVLYSSIIIQNQTKVYLQKAFISASDSSVEIIDSQISNIQDVGSKTTVVINCKLTYTNVEMVNLTRPDNSGLIFVTAESQLEVTNMTFKASDTFLFFVQDSSANLSQISFEIIIDACSLIEFKRSSNIRMDAINILSSSSVTKQYFIFESTANIVISNVVVSHSTKLLIKALDSTFTEINNITVKNSLKVFEFTHCVVKNTSGCEFSSNGNSLQERQSMIKSTNTEMTIHNSSFTNNTAISGGAISFLCTSNERCALNIVNSSFINNIAVVKGGAIYYDHQPPIITSVEFQNNSAPYGNNLASYPYCISLDGLPCDSNVTLSKYGSGIVSQTPHKFTLYDFDHQVMNLDNLSLLVVTPLNNSSGKVSGFNNAIVKNGVANFDNLKLIADPGSPSVIFKVSSKTLDKDKLREVHRRNETDRTLTVNFRYCQPGEKINEGYCEVCSAGTYSLKWNSTSCHKCVDDADCNGGSAISVNKGYWRRTSNSTTILKCLYEDACEGGFVQGTASPTNCKEGYEGSLCSKCSIIEGSKYVKGNELECEKCPDLALSAIFLSFRIITILVFFMIIICVNARKTKESDLSVLLKILTNYIQVMMTSMSMTVYYPKFGNIFSIFNSVGAPSNFMLSFDCLSPKHDLTGPFNSNSVFKRFLLIFLPVAIFMIISIFWILVYLAKFKFGLNLLKNLIVSFVSVILLLHPNLTQESINMWRCVQIDQGMKVARFNMDLECYSLDHIKYCLLISVPILAVWVIAMPIVALVLLYKHRMEDGDNKIKQYLLILHQGLKPERFYWEFVNSLRKSLVVACLLLDKNMRIGVASVILIATARIQLNLQPYKDTHNNWLEYLAIMCGVVTIISCLLYSGQRQIDALNLIMICLVLMINFLFVANWIYCLAKTYEEDYKAAALVSKILACLLCKKSKNENFQSPSPSPRNSISNTPKKLYKMSKNRLRRARRAKKSHKASKFIKKKINTRSRFKKFKKSPRPTLHQTTNLNIQSPDDLWGNYNFHPYENPPLSNTRLFPSPTITNRYKNITSSRIQ